MCFADDKENPDYRRILRHIELIDDEASEYGITIVKSTDKLMAKKYGYRKLPGLTYFRKGISPRSTFMLCMNTLVSIGHLRLNSR